MEKDEKESWLKMFGTKCGSQDGSQRTLLPETCLLSAQLYTFPHSSEVELSSHLVDPPKTLLCQRTGMLSFPNLFLKKQKHCSIIQQFSSPIIQHLSSKRPKIPEPSLLVTLLGEW